MGCMVWGFGIRGLELLLAGLPGTNSNTCRSCGSQHTAKAAAFVEVASHLCHQPGQTKTMMRMPVEGLTKPAEATARFSALQATRAVGAL